MTIPRFVQIHSLHAYTGVLLNRDDSGLAKRMQLGGYFRTRVSSQCLKRHWRVGAGDGMGLEALGEKSVRTRLLDRRIEAMLAESRPAVPEALRKAAGDAVATMVYGKKERQALLFGENEIAYMHDLAAGLVDGAKDAKEVEERGKALSSEKDGKANLKAMRESVQMPGGIVASLFGRMVAADAASNTNAAINVAHAFTVHAMESEGDALTVVDDLVDREIDGAGSGGMFDTEIHSGVFYGYVSVDVPQLVANVTGVPQERFAEAGVDRALAGAILERLVRVIATVSPGAKKGSTAPFGYAESMLVEIGDAQPRSLAGAFHDPSPCATARSPGRRPTASRSASRPWTPSTGTRRPACTSRSRTRPSSAARRPTASTAWRPSPATRSSASPRRRRPDEGAPPPPGGAPAVLRVGGGRLQPPRLGDAGARPPDGPGRQRARVPPDAARPARRIAVAHRVRRAPRPVGGGHRRLPDRQDGEDRRPLVDLGRAAGREGDKKTYDSPYIRKAHYHADRVCVVALGLRDGAGPSLDDVAQALRRPARTLHIGRKACIPSAPLLAGFREGVDLLDIVEREPLRARPDREALLVQVDGDRPGAPWKAVQVTDARGWRLQAFGGCRTVSRAYYPAESFGRAA